MSKYKINEERNSFGVNNTSCGPTKKQLKAEVKEIKLALQDIDDLQRAGYIHSYDMYISLYGNLTLRITHIEERIKNIKKNKLRRI